MFYRQKIIVNTLAVLFVIFSCNQRNEKAVPAETQKKENTTTYKTPTIYTDTLTITTKAAIFFYPDSLQLKKMRAASDTSKFDAIMHEYDYQFRYVHGVLKKYWTQIQIMEAKNIRYLLFIKTDKTRQVIDLDHKNDLYGLIVFDPSGNPTFIDMTNAESQIAFYFDDAEKMKKPVN
jgi:hypothetical protein